MNSSHQDPLFHSVLHVTLRFQQVVSLSLLSMYFRVYNVCSLLCYAAWSNSTEKLQRFFWEQQELKDLMTFATLTDLGVGGGAIIP